MMTFRSIILLLLLSGLLNAAVKEVEVKTTGFTKQEAVYNGLIEAVRQINGVSVASKTKTNFSHEEISSDINGVSKDGSLSNSSIKKDVNTYTKGAVESYEILDSRKSANEWNVHMLVRVPYYKAPGLSTKNRRKIAVMPFHTTKNSFYIGNKAYSGTKISSILTQALITNITQTRKFAVVDRSYVRDMQNELGMIKSGQTTIHQKIKLGQKLSADYLLVGTIQEASVQNHTSHNQLLGSSTSKNVAEFIIDYRIVVVGSSQIKWSDTTRARIDLSNEKQSVEMALSKTIDTLAHSITNTLTSNIYPVKIIEITNSGTLVLNQGGNSLVVGLQMDVMKLGKKMIDPYTKESLGRVESKVAKIEITQVTPKLSYAKVVEGTLSLIKKNDICRREKSESTSTTQSKIDNPNWRKSSVVVEETGGVKLPFD